MDDVFLTSTWRANFRPHFEGVRYRWSDLILRLVAGQRYELTMEYDESHLAEDSESPIALNCVPDTALSGIEFSPPEKKLVELVRDPSNFSSVTWIISTEQANPGTFHIYFSMPGFSGMPDSPQITGQIERVVIDSLICDRPITYIGYEVHAEVRVLAFPSGQPVPDISLEWTYAGQSLPSSTTDENGIASRSFSVPEVGEHELTVRVAGSPDSKTLQIVVQELRPASIYRMTQFPFELPVGKSSEIAAFVRDRVTLKSLPGRKVVWTFNGFQFDVSYTDSTGRATTRWLATGAVMGVVYVWAHVHSENHTAEDSAPLNVVRAQILD